MSHNTCCALYDLRCIHSTHTQCHQMDSLCMFYVISGLLLFVLDFR